MQRISVVGSSGSGKSTVARQLATGLGIPHVELDALHWGPDWDAASPEQLRERTEAATSGETWVIDGNYQSKIGELVWERADTVVWLNPPRWRAMAQVLRRTVRRAATGQELWNGNRESWAGLKFWRGEESILWWAWHSYRPTQERYAAAMTRSTAHRVEWHRLRTRRDVARFLDSLR